MQVQAQVNTGEYAGRSATVEYSALDVEDLAGLVQNFDEDVIFNHAKRSFVISLQAYVRAQIESGKSQEEIQEAVSEWKPGQRRQTKTPAEKIQDLLAKLSPADREAFLQNMQNGE